MGMNFRKSHKGTIRIKTIRCNFQQLQQPHKVKVKRTIHCISIVTQHSQIVFFINHMIIYKYIPFISFCFNIYQGEVPQYGVCLTCGPIHMGNLFAFDVPQNGYVSESLTHTSGHRLFKSAPRAQPHLQHA